MTKKPLIIEVSTEKEWLNLLTVQVRRNLKLLCEKKFIVLNLFFRFLSIFKIVEECNNTAAGQKI